MLHCTSPPRQLLSLRRHCQLSYVVVADRKQAFSAKTGTRRRSEHLHSVVAAKVVSEGLKGKHQILAIFVKATGNLLKKGLNLVDGSGNVVEVCLKMPFHR